MFSKVALGVCLAAIFLGGESIRFNPPSEYPFIQPDAHRKILKEGNGPITSMDSAPPNFGEQIPQHERDTWSVECTSVLTNHECDNIKDGFNNTFWQTKVDTHSTDPLPHSITIDLRDSKNVNAISMRPLPDADLGGAVAGHKVYLSRDAKTWNLVAFGTWFEDLKDKFAIFEPQEAQYVRLEAISATQGTQFTRIVRIGVWATNSPTPSSVGLGKWGPTVDFPLVPVGVFIDPIGGKVISFSSYAHDSFSQGLTDHTTLTATWDPTTQTISHRQVRKTDHDMFCPGMTFDVNGRMIISGGESADRVSIYNATDDDWYKLKEMKIARGYQGSTILANGHIFVIGGSWGPVGIDFGDRNGEVYDPVADEWDLLDDCESKDIETTQDWEGEYRADNHVWLMAWQNNSIFHAGPSKDMHWITPTGEGAIHSAGQRGVGSSPFSDSMCGVAAMYDAAEGKILAAGGAPSYNYLDGDGKPRGGKATTDAFILTLGEVNSSVEVKSAGQGMHHPRSFAHAVILPNGETLVVGGQAEPRVFTQKTAQFTPEIYSPTKNVWTEVAPNSIARTYHSFALLLRDATVLVGGGGLTIQLDVNHFDAQIYIPQYLLTANGERAKRPVIKATSDTIVSPGGNFTIATDVEVVSASLVRYGGATHSLNNDQRRIALKLKDFGTPLAYGVSIPEDGGVAVPGYWMLFVMDSQGVPSEAKNVQILVAENYEA
ncbi:galactose oxidase, partial [Lecanoromycetidae sp. Uapishka_2]